MAAEVAAEAASAMDEVVPETVSRQTRPLPRVGSRRTRLWPGLRLEKNVGMHLSLVHAQETEKMNSQHS